MNVIQFAFYLIGGFIFLLILSYSAFRIAVQRGGRKVEAIDPFSWIIMPRVEVEVQRKDKTTLQICWNINTSPVRIFVRTEPEEITAGSLVQEIEGSREAVITGLDQKSRHYFHLIFHESAPIVAAERMLPLKSIANIRDMGGYRTVNDQLVRWGLVYRSGDLSRLSQRDSEYLQRLGIRLICDLRNTQEVESRPDNIPVGVNYLRCPVYEDEFPRLVMPVMLFNRHKLGETLGSGYTEWLEIGATAYGQLFKAMTDRKNLPILFHCSAGKDRAGIAAAIMLSLLGIPDETIIADYSLTNLAFDHLLTNFKEENQLDRLRIPVDDARIMFAANPEWIRSTLDYLRINFKGAEGYLQNRLNLSASKIEIIRKNLLVN